MSSTPKLRIGYFTQYQVEELAGDATPFDHMSRAMEGKPPEKVRAQLGRFGFSGDKAMTNVRQLSGGERARLALALVTREAPHILILDEPTNHLDVDAREALVQALNDYQGAVILISHDRHMVELTADRLVLVDSGTATEYDGSMTDYIDFVLGRNQPQSQTKAQGKPKRSQQSSNWREETRQLKKDIKAAEKAMADIEAQCARIDAVLADPAKASGPLAKLSLGELGKQRADLVTKLAEQEAVWIGVSERLDSIR